MLNKFGIYFIEIGNDKWISIATGYGHSLAIKSDGTLWGWGYNAFYQLGNNSSTSRSVPTQIGVASDWKKVSAGAYFSMAIKRNGTIWSWGNSQYGQLGHANSSTKTIPTQIGFDSDWTDVSSGFAHNIALKSNGTIWAWGYNGYGQIGDGTTINRFAPIMVDYRKNWKSISTKTYTNLAVSNDGSLWGWGNNIDGEIFPDGDMYIKKVSQMGTSNEWKDAVTGAWHILALKYDGSVWSGGYSGNGALGDDSERASSGLSKIYGFFNAKSIFAGLFNSFAIQGKSEIPDIAPTTLKSPINKLKKLNKDLTLKWYGKPYPFAYQIQVSKFSDFSSLIIDDSVNTNYKMIENLDLDTDYFWRVLVINKQGERSAWSDVWQFKTRPETLTSYLYTSGDNANGTLGNGNRTNLNYQIEVENISDWSQITGGVSHIAAIKSDGSLWAWGSNNYGQLGDSSSIDRLTPVQVGFDTDWDNVSCSQYHTAAIKKDGTLWATGNNTYGQYGNGNANSIFNTQMIKIGEENDWQTVTTLFEFVIATKTDGSLWGWGVNSGNLGDGSVTQRLSPVMISASPNWVEIGTGYRHTIALKSDGTIWTWGINNNGQLGNGTNTISYIPIQVGNSTDWSSVSAGENFNLAQKSDGSLWSWGQNNNGQLGDGSNIDRPSPVQVGNSTDWVKYSANTNFSSAIKSDGSLWAWGLNSSGQLGDTTNENRNTPTQIGQSNDWYSVCRSAAYSLSILKAPSIITKVDLVLPENNSLIQSLALTLEWNSALNADSYDILVSKNQAFTDIILDINTTMLVKSISSLDNGTTYYWKGRGRNADGLGPWSDIWNFTTETTSANHSLYFKSGWNLISTYVAPEMPDSLQYVTEDLNPNLVIVKNAAGKIFMPNAINQIGKWDITFGYQAYMTKADTLSIVGTAVVPEDTPVYLNNGWSIIPYLRNTSLSIVTALASITDAGRLVIVKRIDGKIFMPNAINQIGNQIPGEGYQAYLNAKDTLIYPANTLGRTASSNQIQDYDARNIKLDYEYTGNNSSLIMDIDLADNSEIAVFNAENKIVGAGRVVSGKTVIAIWGQVEFVTDNNNSELRLMSYENEKFTEIKNIEFTEIITGKKSNKIAYNKDAVYLAKATQNDLQLSVNPNPFSNTTEVIYELSDNCEIELSLYNLSGMKVIDLANGMQTKGLHKLTINAENLSSGTYSLILRSCGKSITEKVVVVK